MVVVRDLTELLNVSVSHNRYNIVIFAHVRDGTTDVTRTMHFGTPTPYQKVGLVYL